MEQEKLQIDLRYLFYQKQNFLEEDYLSNLLEWVKTKNFNEAPIVGDIQTGPKVKKDIRNSNILQLHHLDESLTNVKHTRILQEKFYQLGLEYLNKKKVSQVTNIKKQIQLQILKYTTGGFYTYHTDYCFSEPRNLSFVYLLNDDFEGGNLSFYNIEKDVYFTPQLKRNSIIVFPSNFIFPHTVEPVTKGIRYTCVGWAA